MSCLPCFQSKKTNEPPAQDKPVPVARPANAPSSPPHSENNYKSPCENGNNNQCADQTSPPVENGDSSNARTFTFRELASATKNFRQECLIGEGGFGKVFKGTLQGGEVVAVKLLDRTGTQGNKEFQVEVLMLSLLNHQNLVNLIGYCADGDQRILVYEYRPMGSLSDHLIDIKEDQKPLDWQKRIKIASGAAQGLEYLHEKANPPIIYRDLRTTNILLDQDFNPRLSDYGLAKLAGGGNKSHISPRIMGTYGYCAPEYERSGELSFKSDVYSFGVVLLELITGRRAVDTTRPPEEQNLVSWAEPIFRNPKRFREMADPLLKNKFPETSLNQAVGVAAMCLQEEPSVRPLISDVVAALTTLNVDEPIPESLWSPEKDSIDTDEYEKKSSDNEALQKKNEDDSSENDQQNIHYNQRVGTNENVFDSDEDDGASSDYGYGSTSGSSDNEKEDSRLEPEGGMPTKSVKWGTKSRRKSKIKSSSRTISSRSRSKRKVKRSESIISKDDSDKDTFNLKDNSSLNHRQQNSLKAKNVSFGAYSGERSDDAESDGESDTGFNHTRRVQFRS